MKGHKFSNEEKLKALRELETAHFECGLPGALDMASIEARMRRAFVASNRMREILALPFTRVPL